MKTEGELQGRFSTMGQRSQNSGDSFDVEEGVGPGGGGVLLIGGSESDLDATCLHTDSAHRRRGSCLKTDGEYRQCSNPCGK